MSTSEMPGTSRDSLRIAAVQAAEVLCQMVKGSCPFNTALRILKGRSPVISGWVEELTVSLAREKLALQGIKVHEHKKVAQKSLTEAFTPDQVEAGDLVGFGSDKFYVLDESYQPSYFWVTTSKNDRFDPDAKGFAIYKKSADSILEKGSVALSEYKKQNQGTKRSV